ncbi:MAG: hypothetical protein SGI71_02555 [Verrucomicrobiota bacterium]|nr:hypothetical protein [Verrucomicrobiota bacterium]
MHQQKTQPHIFAGGDVCSEFPVLHMATLQGEVAAHNAWSHLHQPRVKMHRMDYRSKLFVLFTWPQVAVLGLTEKELRRNRIPYFKGACPFSENGKAQVMEETDGFAKILVHRKTREIIGAAAISADASELIHEMCVAMHYHATVDDLLKIPHYHPTLSEIWTSCAETCLSKNKGPHPLFPTCQTLNQNHTTNENDIKDTN